MALMILPMICHKASVMISLDDITVIIHKSSTKTISNLFVVMKSSISILIIITQWVVRIAPTTKYFSTPLSMSVIILENIRSAYNVGNIIRTADAFGWSVVIAGYTPSHTHPKVLKTSLGAEQSVSITQFFAEALEHPDGFMDRSPNRTAID